MESTTRSRDSDPRSTSSRPRFTAGELEDFSSEDAERTFVEPSIDAQEKRAYAFAVPKGRSRRFSDGIAEVAEKEAKPRG